MYLILTIDFLKIYYLKESNLLYRKNFQKGVLFGHKYHVQKLKEKKEKRETDRQEKHTDCLEDSGILEMYNFLCTDEI